MCADVLAELVRLVAQRPDLAHSEGRMHRIGGPCGASRRGDLDEVRPLLDQLSDRGPALVLTGRLDPEVSQVAADDGHGPPGENQSRSRRDTHLHGLPEHEGRSALGPAVAHRRHPGVEVSPCIAGRLKRQYLVGELVEVVPRPSVTNPDEVHVAVDKARQQRPIVFELLDRRTVRRDDRVPPAGGPDCVALHQNGGILQRRRTCTVDQTRRPDEP